jgi:hypothetical protein
VCVCMYIYIYIYIYIYGGKNSCTETNGKTGEIVSGFH